MVDLKAKPYCLSEADIQWVNDTIASMSAEKKVGHLFFQLCAGNSEESLKERMEKYHLGGCRYNNMPGKMVQATAFGNDPIDSFCPQVYYYPSLVNNEEDSWKELRETGYDMLKAGTYGGDYPDTKKKRIPPQFRRLISNLHFFALICGKRL